jgi:virginiamycin B lyase
MSYRILIPVLVTTLLTAADARPAEVGKPASAAKPAPIVRTGVKTPGIQQPITALKPDAAFPIEGTPDWIAVDSSAAAPSVWVSNKPKNTVHRLDPATNKFLATVPVGAAPCSGLAIGFGSLWVPSCGDKTISRVSLKENKVIATVAVGPAQSEGGLTVSPDSVWVLTESTGKLARIDPDTNMLVATINVPIGSYAAVYGDGAIWVSSTEKNQVARVDPKTNLVTDLIETGPQPRFLTFGAGSVWTLNQGDGSVTRIDTTKKIVAATIECGVPGPGGEISFGENAVWVTAFQVPLTRIDATSNKVVQQWTGLGGDSVRFGLGSIWLSNLKEQNVWRLKPPALP